MMDPRAQVRAELESLARLATETIAQAETLLAIAERYRMTLAAGGTLFFAGNGGSAADAQHVAAEYVVKFQARRPGLRAIALTTDTSILTAAGNDLGFEQVFARQVATLCRPGDLLVLHSTSGESENLLEAARAARGGGVPVVAFLGRGGGRLAALADLTFVVAADQTSRIQEIHMAAQHIIAGLLDREAPG
jgi:D-sedoheptulose 7-phosphate isomerase